MKTPIPNTLLYHRHACGLLQKDVAKKLGVNFEDRISRWERGLKVPNIFNLFKLAQIYNVLPHELYPELLQSRSDPPQEEGVA